MPQLINATREKLKYKCIFSEMSKRESSVNVSKNNVFLDEARTSNAERMETAWKGERIRELNSTFHQTVANKYTKIGIEFRCQTTSAKIALGGFTIDPLVDLGMVQGYGGRLVSSNASVIPLISHALASDKKLVSRSKNHESRFMRQETCTMQRRES